MQQLQESLAVAAAAQASRQNELVEQQLAWYRTQQEQQQQQLEQVQSVSTKLLSAEAEQAQLKLEKLQRYVHERTASSWSPDRKIFCSITHTPL